MKLGKVLAIVVPILIMAGWAGKHILHTSLGAKVRLAVKGYDPRDLLAGHYLRYAVEYGANGNCGSREGEACLCLSTPEGGGVSTATGLGNCRDRDSACSLWLRGRCERGNFVAGIERFYMSEGFAPSVKVIPPNADIEVSLDGRGSGVVTEFFVEGKPLREYVLEQQK